MKKYLSWKLLTILIATLLIGIFDLPSNVQSAIGLPESITSHKVHLGLDLQGGSQLDYKIDLRKVPEADRENIIAGVREVIEKRVNGLGVTEPNIYLSEIADEQHLIVELAESGQLTQEDVNLYLGAERVLDQLNDDERKLVSLEKAKAVVGKTIQLEFKEEKTTIDPEEKEQVLSQANAALNRIKEGADFSVVGQEEQQAYPGKVSYEKSQYQFADKIPGGIKDAIINMEAGNFTQELKETGGTFTVDASGQLTENKGVSIVKLLDKKEEIKAEKQVAASHILIAHEGAEGADAQVSRTEDEAYNLSKEIVQKLKDGASFEDLAKEYSSDASNKEEGGTLGTPVTGDGTYVFDFEKAALELEKAGDYTEKAVKTQFGYHVIKADNIETDVKAPQYQYEIITYSTQPNPWKDTGLTGEHFVHADVQLDNFYQPYVSIQFNEEGAQLFKEITERNINKPVAIFVGGELISAPTVQAAIPDGNAIITGQFTMDEANTLARDLNTGAIPAPIVLTGEYTIGATLGKSALQQSLFAGIIGLLLIMVFMAVYYRLSGIIANLALIVYAAILIFLFKAQLPLVMAIFISLAIFGFLVYKIVNNKDSGWEKLISFVLSCIAFVFIAILLETPVVLTLAGVAGLVLSIGMAVDANILIFERFKEEIRDGKTFRAAVDDGFSRAWSSIRDSNFSTLLTCAILFYFGTSVIKGFAFTLAAGVVVSMFTALTVTRILLQSFVGKKIAANTKLFGANPKKKEFKFDFIKRTKTWFSISGAMIAISILSFFVFGLNMGIDFTGGTLLEFKFSEPVTKEQLATDLKEIGEELNENLSTGTPVPTSETENSEILPSATPADQAEIITLEDQNPIDLNNVQIIPGEENSFIVKTKYLSSADHDLVVEKMKERLPDFTEPRFNTIGPTLGSDLLSNAIKAIIAAIIIIVFYIAFAFRKIPKSISPWRFGAAAIFALLHDVIIVTGFFVILGQFLNVEIDTLFVTAMLTVFGYSVNDTIVVFDRLRENILRSKDGDIAEIANTSLNQTLTRSINTSFSTLLTLLAVLILGSSSIFYFVLALTAGIILGTYSSIFTASPILVAWIKSAQRKQK